MDNRLKYKTVKLLEENTGQNIQNIHDLGLDKEFLNMTSKARSIKENKWISWTSPN